MAGKSTALCAVAVALICLGVIHPGKCSGLSLETETTAHESIPMMTFKDPTTGHEINQLTNQYIGLPKDHTCACVNMAPPPKKPQGMESALIQTFEQLGKARRMENLNINGEGRFLMLEEAESSEDDGDNGSIGVNIRPSMPADKDGTALMNGQSPSAPGKKSMFCYCSKKHGDFKFNAKRYKQKCSRCCYDLAWKKEKQKGSVTGNTKPTRLNFEDMKWQCKRRCKKLCRRSCMKKAAKYSGGELSDSEYTTYRSKCMAICDQAFTALVQNDPTGKNYHFLRPFTTRIFDRRYGLKYYRGERDSSIWNDRMRFVRYFLGEEKNGSVEGLAHAVNHELAKEVRKPDNKPPPDPMKEHKLLTTKGTGGSRQIGDKYWDSSDAATKGAGDADGMSDD